MFTNAPDPIRLLLTQAIFEKLWVMDTEVVGADLTDPYLELLSTEARLAEEANELADNAASELAIIPAPRMDYRRVGAIMGDDSDEETAELAARLWVERPRGRLPVDALNSQNPASPAVMTGLRRESSGRGDRI